MLEILEAMEQKYQNKALLNEDKKKQFALMTAICREIDLSDSMDINENMLKMRNAGKARIVKKLH